MIVVGEGGEGMRIWGLLSSMMWGWQGRVGCSEIWVPISSRISRIYIIKGILLLLRTCNVTHSSVTICKSHVGLDRVVNRVPCVWGVIVSRVVHIRYITIVVVTILGKYGKRILSNLMNFKSSNN